MLRGAGWAVRPGARWADGRAAAARRAARARAHVHVPACSHVQLLRAGDNSATVQICYGTAAVPCSEWSTGVVNGWVALPGLRASHHWPCVAWLGCAQAASRPGGCPRRPAAPASVSACSWLGLLLPLSLSTHRHPGAPGRPHQAWRTSTPPSSSCSPPSVAPPAPASRCVRTASSTAPPSRAPGSCS